MPVNRQKLEFFLIRALTYPFGLMPLSWIRAIGRCAGAIGFYLLRDYRKRTLSNLALATGLKLTQKEQIRYAKESFQNLAITCLEYPKFARKNHLSKMMRCENPEIADKLHASGQGIIFFCGHQSNWEVLFLEGTMRMKGTAIGKSIKNKLLYNWVLSIREQNGGKIIAPHNALREGLRALRKGEFLGIVGDQGMPNSGYSYPFLGRRAWTTTAPAILSYKANCPLIFASTKRTPKGYSIRYSDPLWPNLKAPLESETIRLMNSKRASRKPPENGSGNIIAGNSKPHKMFTSGSATTASASSCPRIQTHSTPSSLTYPLSRRSIRATSSPSSSQSNSKTSL
jgi:Kdo2-lipid IVA lauroyltransferase/acyltransferase